jgi:large subunit ribosomal protein L22
VLFMPTWGYSVTKLDPERSAIASGRDMPISFKDAVEICKSIKGLDIESAKKFLEDVIAMKRMVPIKRYKKKLPHHSLQGWYAGRYPVKASKYILDVVKQLEANAEYKGLDENHSCSSTKRYDNKEIYSTSLRSFYTLF